MWEIPDAEFSVKIAPFATDMMSELGFGQRHAGNFRLYDANVAWVDLLARVLHGIYNTIVAGGRRRAHY
ncbi:MAG: hypothetical protein QM811_08070 [Pirellulales bacterium]